MMTRRNLSASSLGEHRKERTSEAFNDGVVTIYVNNSVGGIGDIPRENLEKRVTLRFRERTVGIKQYYEAMQHWGQVSRKLRTLRRDDVSVLDIAEVNGSYYRILQIQYIEDIKPNVMDISLEKVVIR